MNEAAQQQKAYDAGVQVGLHPATAKQPTDLLWEQAKTGYDDESLVCYLNGIGDALAGYKMHWSEHWNLADEVFPSPFTQKAA